VVENQWKANDLNL